MMEGEEEEAGAGRKEEQEHIFSEIVKVSFAKRFLVVTIICR